MHHKYTTPHEGKHNFTQNLRLLKFKFLQSYFLKRILYIPVSSLSSVCVINKIILDQIPKTTTITDILTDILRIIKQ